MKASDLMIHNVTVAPSYSPQYNISSDENSDPLPGLINGEQMKIINLFVVVASLILCGCGTLTNALSIRAFFKIGLHDGVNLSLFHLSAVDLALCLSDATCIAAFALQQVEWWEGIRYAVDPNIVTVYFSNFGEMFYLATALTTTLIAVVRCTCIAAPLQFKNIFTVTRTVYVLVILDIFTVANFLPILVSFETTLKTDPVTNITRPVMYLSSERDTAQDIKSSVVDIAVAVTTEVIVVACLFVMTYKLRQATKFRRATTVHLMGSENRMSSGSYLVLQQIVFISTLFIVCNTPKTIIAFIRMTVSEFDAGKRYSNLYIVAYEFRLIIETFISILNFLIYYKFNAKFRSLVCCGSIVKKERGRTVVRGDNQSRVTDRSTSEGIVNPAFTVETNI